MIGVPSRTTPVERRAVTDAAFQADASEVYLVEQAMVAAIGAGLPITEPSGSMIVDIGGGTTDTAVISLSGIVYSSSIRTAGNAMDEAVIAYLKDKYNLYIGERTAERVKIEIGSAHPNDKPLTMEIKGRSRIEGMPRMAKINDTEIREALSNCVDVIVHAIHEALEKNSSRIERRYQRPRHRSQRRRRVVARPGPAHPRKDGTARVGRRRAACGGGQGHRQDIG